MKKLISFLILVICAATTTPALAIAPDWVDSGKSFGRATQVFEDSLGNLGMQAVLDCGELCKFTPAKSSMPTFGFKSGGIWFKFELENFESFKPDELLFEVAWSNLDRVDAYAVDSRKRITKLASLGKDYPFEQRIIRHRNFVIPISKDHFQLGTSIYLRVASKNTISLPFYLFTRPYFEQKANTEYLWLSIFYGTLGCLILLCLILYLYIRDPGYLYASGFFLTGTLFRIAVDGTAYQFIWPNAIEWNRIGGAWLGTFGPIFSSMMAIEFLELRTQRPAYSRFLIGLCFFGLAMGLGFKLIPFETQVKLGSLIGLVVYTSYLWISASMWRQGYKPAKLFLIGWVPLLLAIMIGLAKNLAIIDGSWLTIYCTHIGSAAQGLLLSIALATKVKWIDAQKKVATEILIHRKEMEKELELTSMVQKLLLPEKASLSVSGISVHFDQKALSYCGGLWWAGTTLKNQVYRAVFVDSGSKGAHAAMMSAEAMGIWRAGAETQDFQTLLFQMKKHCPAVFGFEWDAKTERIHVWRAGEKVRCLFSPFEKPAEIPEFTFSEFLLLPNQWVAALTDELHDKLKDQWVAKQGSNPVPFLRDQITQNQPALQDLGFLVFRRPGSGETA